MDCYLEWDWNYDFGGIGTSDEELCEIIEPKLCYRPPTGVDENWLVVAGGVEISSTIGFLWQEQLSSFQRLNEQLASGLFDHVAILGLEWFQWTRQSGWRPIEPLPVLPVKMP